jgi:hypothetical protein
MKASATPIYEQVEKEKPVTGERVSKITANIYWAST